MKILRGFILPHEVELLEHAVEFATGPRSPCGYLPGRQASGYEKLFLKDNLVPASLLMRSIQALQHVDGDNWDCFTLNYPPGSYIPRHVDQDAKAGMRHIRINAIITPADSGGVLTIDDKVIDLYQRDAVIFHPDTQYHSVTHCTSTRLIWSVGAWIPERFAL